MSVTSPDNPANNPSDHLPDPSEIEMIATAKMAATAPEEIDEIPTAKMPAVTPGEVDEVPTAKILCWLLYWYLRAS